MCPQVYRSMCTDLRKRHLTTAVCSRSVHIAISFNFLTPRVRTCVLADLLELVENTSVLGLLSSLPVVSPTCPCHFRVKTEVHTLIFWSFDHVFREACPAVNWFACRRLERYGGSLTTVRTCDFEHSFLQFYWSPLFVLSVIGDVKDGRKMMPS